MQAAFQTLPLAFSWTSTNSSVQQHYKLRMEASAADV